MKISNKYSAFTLIEILVAIAIIGILATLAVVALQNTRSSSRDAKRISDIKQMQIALEMYFNDNGVYPLSSQIVSGISKGGVVYMQSIPTAPTPADGSCSSEDNDYKYLSQNGDSYMIIFCLGSSIGNLNSGIKIANSQGVGTEYLFRDNLFGYWVLSEANYNSSSNQVLDLSTYNNNATNYGAIFVNDKNGNLNSAMEFNGINSYIKLPSDVVSTQNIRDKGITYTAWIKMLNNNLEQNIVGQKPHSGYSNFSSGGLVVNSDNKAAMIVYDDNIAYKSSIGNTNLQSNVWYFLAGTYDPSDKNIRIYVNGKIDGNPVLINTLGRLFSNTYNNIGYQTHVSSPNYFNGQISKVRIYNKTLSEDDLFAIYMSEK